MHRHTINKCAQLDYNKLKLNKSQNNCGLYSRQTESVSSCLKYCHANQMMLNRELTQ